MRLQRLKAAVRKAGACDDARKWLDTLPLTTTAQQAWDQCQRGDWMIWWWATACPTERPAVVLAACQCARTALTHVPAGELRPLRAIEAAEAWARNPSEAARAAAGAASDAAWAVSDAAGAVSAAAGAASAAAWAASDAQCADLVRAARPELPMPKGGRKETA